MQFSKRKGLSESSKKIVLVLVKLQLMVWLVISYLSKEELKHDNAKTPPVYRLKVAFPE